MLSLHEARGLLATRVSPLAAIERPLGRAAGLRLASGVRAAADLPVADLSAMDGYAARAIDLRPGTPLLTVAAVAAGSVPAPLPPGSAARIFTGAVVPPGADTVVPQEDARLLADGRVRLGVVPAGSHVRPRGEVFRAGQPLAGAGDALTPTTLATLAAGGVPRVAAHPRPRVAILVTGTELASVRGRTAPGRVRDSNGPMLAALASEAGLKVAFSHRVADDLPVLTASLEEAAGVADLVITSGGVSVGDFDLVPETVTAIGGETVFHQVAIQPGKPILVAVVRGCWLVGAPGNAVSALVAWRMFARPLAEALAGDRHAFDEAALPATLATAVANRGDRMQLRPADLATAAEGLTVTVRPWRGSHDIASAAGATALACMPRGVELPAGASVECYPLPWRWSG